MPSYRCRWCNTYCTVETVDLPTHLLVRSKVCDDCWEKMSHWGDHGVYGLADAGVPRVGVAA